MKDLRLIHFLAVTVLGFFYSGLPAQVVLPKNLALEISRAEKRPPSFVRDTLLIANYNEMVGELLKKETPDSAIRWADKALKLSKKRQWQPGILRSLMKKASCENIANRHYDAIQTAQEGLRLAEALNDLNSQCAFQRSLGNNFDMLDNYAMAIPHYESCLRLSASNPSLRFIRGHCLVELGDAYRFDKKQPQVAKKMIEEAILIYTQTDSSALGYGLDYYGQALTDMGDFKEADSAFILARHYVDKYEKEYLLPELLFHHADLYFKNHRYTEAISKAKECLTVSKEKKTIYSQREAHRILYLSYKNTAEYSKALLSHEQFAMLNDSMNLGEIKSKFQNLQYENQLQKQNDKISQLTIAQQTHTQQILTGSLVILLALAGYVFYNNRQLRRKNRAISAALLEGQTTERKRVAADLHDSLGSTLSSLRWSMGAIDKNKLEPKEQELYQHVQSAIEQAYDQVRLLSHNLLPDELGKKGLWMTLEQLVRKLNKNTPVAFSLQLPDNQPRLNQKTEFELYSICLELINNILKHAQATEASIAFEIVSNQLQLTIIDNGKGIAENTASGKGLQNIAERVKSLKGSWKVTSTNGKGTVNEIILS